jgi:hypothetical protein
MKINHCIKFRRIIMNKIKKRVVSLVTVCALCMSILSIVASAAAVSAGAYGTLTGTVTLKSSSCALFCTSVTNNPDNAILTIKYSIVDKKGNVLDSYDTGSIYRGVCNCGVAAGITSTTYAGYGTHGVKGGSIYGAYAAYTYTKF